MEIFHTIYSVAIDSFFKVGVFVSLSLILIGLIDYKFNGIIIKILEKDQKNGVFFSTLLGLIPGCGGAIVIVPLFIRKKVSFGSLVAAFITTMGDAAFVLIVGDITAYFKILIITGVVGISFGLVIDKFKIGQNIILNKEFKNNNSDILLNEESGHENHTHIAHEKGDVIDKVLHQKTSLKYIYILTHKIWYKIFWILVIISIPFSIEHISDGHSHVEHGGINLFEFIGVLGTFLCIIYTISSRKVIKGSDFDKTESKLASIGETFIHTAEEVAFLVTWVFIAFLSYEIVLSFIGGENELKLLLNSSGYLVVVGSVLIGLIPGCGPQILLATLYISGAIPFSALVANAICNDGDALFPLIALSKKSALMVTICNTIPALLIGGLIYLIEK
ncbi:MAG: putative manganese transporter [Cetobacterium sp.]